ncbi:malto-oligosyltrehalose trehalohydrolase [Paludibaculum fermentans]|uniref:Malto-oligosyltrehalose trehalohydrolase n=1 Tax=Paludibaculum fermentans TaxID=1473598 RepID=A0A7S7SI20_PALFE|nr:malto-oligosyltrehalose trehalohydrolase [Paludibaculum fermentans]QOY85253.1 malto-oligosyltrehalose trehalohydrolase [Paludibaculum fermentans]
MSGLDGRRFGAILKADGVLFQVWSAASQIELVVDGPAPSTHQLQLRSDGLKTVFVPGLAAGARYGYRIDGQGPFPDPAARFQPDGVHGLSEVVDPAFPWTDAGFSPRAWNEAVLYELHCGAFTPQGTFAAAKDRLGQLSDLGITAAEFMPLADSPGRRNWGYDGVSLYAPNRNYGRPEDLRAFVNHAHSLGLAVYLDVVYNHFGPDGAYHRLFHTGFYSTRVKTPWGDSLNFDEEHSANTRAFFVCNALHWLEEYHIDGFRLDATHAIQDRSALHFLAEFAEALHHRAAELGRSVQVIAEDARNLNTILQPPQQGGYGIDAVWADDFHHHVRRALAGDTAGYYADYDGEPASIARTLRNGWFYEGQHSVHHDAPRGTPTGDLDRSRFIICIQNHDQIGNRARGERLHHQIPNHAHRAASALLLLAPETPLLFMGQEWAATTPFQFFTDHNEQLGPLVSDGRRREFAHFPEFSDEASRTSIPDPQADDTFLRSKLRWREREQPEHQAMLRWYTRLIQLRRRIRCRSLHCTVGEQAGLITLEWRDDHQAFTLVVALQGGGELPGACPSGVLLLTSEDPEFVPDPMPRPGEEVGRPLQFGRAGCALFFDGKGED